MEEFSGDTVLISACRMGRIDIVALALERGARNDPHPDFGQTALQAAVSSGHANCVR
jgi:ankyrin repeat protein